MANEDGQSIAAVDLETMAVAKHLAIAGSPSTVISAAKRPFVYVLSANNGTIHEIAVERLALARKLSAGSAAVAMQLAEDESALYVLTREPRALVRVEPESFKVEWRLNLPEEPVDLALAADGKTAAVSLKSSVHLVDLTGRKLEGSLGTGDFGAVRFLADTSTLIVADRGERRLSLYDAAAGQLITHLPLAVRPDHLCFNHDNGQLFVTGDGMDAVVIVYPFRTPEVAETVLAGHAPGPMAASQALLFVASPASGDISILDINSRKVIAVVSAGSDPGFITVTDDDQYALVLNRGSGDVSVLRVSTITRNRDRRAGLLTVIPVGSRPVSAAVRRV